MSGYDAGATPPAYTVSSTLPAMSGTSTLRVRIDTRDRLNRLAREDGVSAPELLERLVSREESARLLRAMNDDFARLRGDAEGWGHFRAETDAWDEAAGA